MRPPPTKPTGPATRPPATAPTAVCVARPAALAAEVAATTAATAAMTANPPSVLIEIILATLAIRQADQDTWPEFGTRRRLSRDRAPWSNDVTDNAVPLSSSGLSRGPSPQQSQVSKRGRVFN